MGLCISTLLSQCKRSSEHEEDSAPIKPQRLTDTMENRRLSIKEASVVVYKEEPSLHKTLVEEDKPVNINSFIMLKLLGRGSFGKVVLVQSLINEKLYAMKLIGKEPLMRKGQELNVLVEKEILTKTKAKLYFVMEFISGGELFFHLRRARRFDEAATRFYATELIVALKHLHEMGIIYRDLKPENILIDTSGHIKLTDFGLCKISRDDEQAYTMCGTPEYVAPEILLRKGHGKSVDWYSLGVLIFEMLYGTPPFYSKDKRKMIEQRLTRPLEIPYFFSQDASDLVLSLIQNDPQIRLGHKGPMELMEHPFFKDIDWNVVARRQAEPPFVPKVQSSLDLRNFDEFFTQETLNDTPVMNEADLKHFERFSYYRLKENDSNNRSNMQQ